MRSLAQGLLLAVSCMSSCFTSHASELEYSRIL
jgi:hypothetical protein